MLFISSIALIGCREKIELEYQDKYSSECIEYTKYKNQRRAIKKIDRKFSVCYVDGMPNRFNVFSYETQRVLKDEYNAVLLVDCTKNPPEQYIRIKEQGKYGLVDQNSRVVLPFQYDSIGGDFGKKASKKKGSAFLLVKENELFGFMNQDFDYVIDPKYSSISWSGKSPGKLIASADGTCGVINFQDDVIIPLEYDTVQFTRLKEIFRVKKGDKYGLINHENNLLTQMKYEYLIVENRLGSFYLTNSKYFACYGFNNKYGLLDQDGHITDLISEEPIIEIGCIAKIEERPEYFYTFVADGKMGLLSSTGETVFEPIYDKIEELNFDKLAIYYESQIVKYNENNRHIDNPRLMPKEKFNHIKSCYSVCDLALTKDDIIDTLNVSGYNSNVTSFAPITVVSFKDSKQFLYQ